MSHLLHLILSRKKKGFDWKAYVQRQINRFNKELREDIHKVGVHRMFADVMHGVHIMRYKVFTRWGTRCSQDTIQGVYRIMYRLFSQNYIQDVHMIRHRVFIGLYRGCSQDEIQGVHTRIMYRMFTWWGNKFRHFLLFASASGHSLYWIQESMRYIHFTGLCKGCSRVMSLCSKCHLQGYQGKMHTELTGWVIGCS